MAGIVNITEACSLAIHAMALLAKEVGKSHSTRELAAILNASENHLSKVMQRLCREKLIDSSRGPGGGFQLGRPADEITLQEIFETIEGRLEPQQCLRKQPICHGKPCVFGNVVRRINEDFLGYLKHTRLSEIAGILMSAEKGN